MDVHDETISYNFELFLQSNMRLWPSLFKLSLINQDEMYLYSDKW